MPQALILGSQRAIDVMKVVGGALVMAASAQISIPMNPVYITFHTVVVMIIGLTYTPALARTTMGAFLLAAALGAPILSGFSGGLPYMMGPTGGYLVGFFAAAAIMPYFQKYYGSGTISILANCLLGSLVIYFLGVSWLSHLIGFEKAFYSGFVVFIPTGIAKIALLTGIMRFIKK